MGDDLAHQSGDGTPSQRIRAPEHRRYGRLGESWRPAGGHGYRSPERLYRAYAKWLRNPKSSAERQQDAVREAAYVQALESLTPCAKRVLDIKERQVETWTGKTVVRYFADSIMGFDGRCRGDGFKSPLPLYRALVHHIGKSGVALNDLLERLADLNLTERYVPVGNGKREKPRWFADCIDGFDGTNGGQGYRRPEQAVRAYRSFRNQAVAAA